MFKVASFFSGCGGLDLGIQGDFNFMGKNYSKNSFEIVFANDFDDTAINTYKANNHYFDDHHLVAGDIRDIELSSLPEFDVLFAGFPCQPFSNAGNRKGVNDKDGRGTLWEECERIIKYSLDNFSEKPKAFVFENVRGITSSKMDNGRTVPEEICCRMESLGYNVSMKLLNSSNYGVPQNRHRFFIIGIRHDLGTFNFDEMTNIVARENLSCAERHPYELFLGNVLSSIPNNASQKEEHWRYSPQGQKMIELIGPCVNGKESLALFKNKVPITDMPATISTGRSWKNIDPADLPPRFRKIHDNPKKYRAPNFYRRFALGEIAGTITASAQPENCGITHPFENRRFSIREIARIQSFPDDFIFPYKSIVNAYKVIGNAVPPVLGWVVAKALQNHLLKKNKNIIPCQINLFD